MIQSDSTPPPSVHAPRISLQVVGAPSPYEAYLLPLLQFPIAGKDLPPVKWFWEQMVAALADEYRLSSQVFLQLTNYKGGSHRFAKHGPSWMPALGLGVWPDRPPPTLWTRDDFKKLAPRESLRPLADQVLHITGDMAGARSEMLDLGSVLEFLSLDNGKVLLEKARKLLLPRIQEPSFRVYSIYIPLLQGKAIATASAEQLTDWLCGASMYIRESVEDRGILIVSGEPLTPFLEELGGRYEKKPEPHWEVAVRG